MSSGSYRQVNVKCPFYRYDDGSRRIVCEGAFDPEDSLASIFRTRSGYLRQIDGVCCEEYEKCEIYRLLMRRYEDDENSEDAVP